jgi:hypothetical protein
MCRHSRTRSATNECGGGSGLTCTYRGHDDAHILYATEAGLSLAVLGAQQHCYERKMRPMRILQHVHTEPAKTSAQWMESCVALVALNLGAALLFAHGAK